jgi:CRP/FNR family transcriptional regulator, cyclic AMP receptor protein
VQQRSQRELDGPTQVSAIFDRFGEVGPEGLAIVSTAPKRLLRAGSSSRADTFRNVPLLIIEEGHLVIRRTTRERKGTMVVCYGGIGTLITAPEPVETLDALDEARVTLISERTYATLLAQPDTATVITDALRAEVRQKRDAIANLVGGRPLERVERTLLQLARDHGRVVTGGIRIDFPLTHELLAEMIGSARETVSRAIEHLESTGFVTREGRSYRLQVRPDSIQ